MIKKNDSDRTSRISNQDVQLAAQVHYSFLPDDFTNEFLEIAVSIKPFQQIGGDYCSILPLDSQRLIVGMCDVVGHSVASALYAARINTFARTHADRANSPGELLSQLNEYLCSRLSQTGIYTAFQSIFFDFQQRSFMVAAGALPPVIHYQSQSRQCKQIMPTTTFLGFQHPLTPEIEPYCGALQSGDRLLLYTDGLSELPAEPEQPENDGEFFGSDGLAAFAQDHPQLGARAFNDALFDRLKIGSADQKELRDDLLLMTICIR